MARIYGIFAALLCAAVLVSSGGASAAKMQEVDLELLLGIDVSGSIDDEEAELQRAGYIAAFRHPMVLKAIRSGMLGRIAIAYIEWAGFGHKKIIVGWTTIHDKLSAEAFAARLTLELPETARRTAISEAIDFAIPYFEQNDFQGLRRVFDISGDGPNNWGDLVVEARDRAVKAGIIINGLPIMNDKPSFSGRIPMPNLDLYYRDCVIGGPGAFIVAANSFKDFASAVRRKLILEIAGLPPRHVAGKARIILAAAREAPPCDYGERSRRQYYEDDTDAWPIGR
ncbi:MAG: DUF1194 domain-containing protein [Alphaproteobacteria bacterium]